MYNFLSIKKLLNATAILLLFFQLSAFAQISDKPLLAAASSAKPNLMFLLDNSGSMQFRHVPDEYRSSFANTLSALSAYTSPDANRLFYNPAVLYTPRPNADGSFQPAATEASARAATTAWDGRGALTPDGIFYVEDCTFAGCSFSLGGNYGNPAGTYSETLTFSICNTRDAARICTAIDTYNIPPPALSANYVPANYVAKAAARIDCTSLPTRCSYAEERQNALNWFLYYSTRLLATATSVGQAFLDTKYVNALRLGYGRMNELRTAVDFGLSPDPAGLIKRGVRPFQDDGTLPVGFRTERTDFYTWLYAQTAFNATPSRQLLAAAGEYFLDASNTGPWSAQPIIGDATAHLSCRRSTSVMFSDGAYNDANVIVAPNVDGADYGTLTNVVHTDPKTGQLFNYSTAPSTTATYIAYPDTTANTMSDIAMSYWIRDLRPDLPDTITPISGNPAYWQHMVFYTIGYGIRGSVTPNDIATYNSNFTRGIASTLAWGDPAVGGINVVNDYIHAGYSGRGKSYSVSTSGEVKRAFDDVLSRTVDQTGNDAGVAVGDTNNSLSTLVGELKYVPSYTVIEGSGDIAAYKLNASGNVITPNAPEWFASRRIPAPDQRNLVTLSSSGGINFSGTFASLPSDIQTSLGTGANDSFIAYIRGQASGVDTTTGNSFRIRPSLFGTVVNSPPTYIRGELNMGYNLGTTPGASSYLSYFTNKNVNSLGLLLAPSNDGMLHVINPQNGDEIMGYLPRSAMPKLKQFATEPYFHKYLLDGPVSEGDIYDASNSSWKSIAFGTGGRGGKFVYAMSVPVSTTAASPLAAPAMTKDNLLWELNSSNAGFSNLGLVTNSVQSGYMRSGDWVAIISNGYDNATGVASLFIVNALTGTLIREIVTGAGTLADPNALTGLTLVRDGSRTVVGAFAGDQQGNMWKFDLRSATPSDWKIAFAGNKPLFKTPGRQPFTGSPAWRPLNGGVLVVAATGQLILNSDPSNLQTQSVYGVLDKTPFDTAENTLLFAAPANMTSLQSQTVTLVGGATNSFAEFFKVSTNTVDYSTQAGWKIDFTFEQGQRSISDVSNLNEGVVIATVIPPQPTTTEQCRASDLTSGYLYFLDAQTGGNVDTGGKNKGKGSGFDINGDFTGDGFSVAKAAGFPRGNVLAGERIGPPGESLVNTSSSGTCNSSMKTGVLLGSGTSSLGLVSTVVCTFLRTWQQLLNPPRVQ